MNKLSKDEVQARIEAIRTGPWMDRSALAKRKLAAPGFEPSAFTSGGRMSLDSFPLDQRAAAIAKNLSATFRWHRSGRIPTQSEQRVRDSFDDALTYLQMIELAIETGYLPADQVADATRADMVSLLWAPPARQFVRIYDYTSVEALAMRLEIGGFPRRRLLPIDPRGAVHFAAFLATHRTLENDAACNTWLGFLDDYIIRRGEQDDFYEYLKSGEATRSRRRLELLLGARNFAVMLADFFSTLPEHLQARFGGFYAYWLAKLFGYERRDGKYIRNLVLGRGKDGWSRALKNWFRQGIDLDTADATAANESALVERSLDILAMTWEHVRRPNLEMTQVSVARSPSVAD
jgi:hypothetical protein